MALIRYIPNKFVDVKYDYEAKSEKLADALYKFTLQYPNLAKPFMNKKAAIYVNGKNFTPDECTKYILNKADIVEVTHSIGEATTWVIVAVIVAIVAAALTYYLTLHYMDFEGETDGGAQTYNWDGPKTNVDPESPIGLIYGEHLVGGQLINFNIWSSGNENYLDILLALGEGEIAGIVDEDQTGLVSSVPTTLEDVDTKTPYIKINDQFASAYDECEWAGRVGTIDQTSISGFRSIKTIFDYPHPVPAQRDIPADNWTTLYTTKSVTDIDQFTVNLTCPALFRMFDNGKIKDAAIWYRVRHRVNSPPGSWVYSPVDTYGADDIRSYYKLSSKTRTELKIAKTITPSARNTYDIQVQRLSPASTTLSSKKQIEDKLNTVSITEVISEDLSYPNTALIALRVKATDQISGAMPNIQILVRGIKVRVPDLTNGGAGDKEFEDYYWTGTGNDFDLIVGSDPVTWNTTSYITQWTSNPAYIIRDLLTSTRYGMGEVVEAADIDDDSIDLAAKKCWQLVAGGHKNELHVVIDNQTEPEDILAQLAKVSRLKIFWAGGYIKFKYEEDEDPVQVFSMGNIKKDSFKVDYIDYTKIPNRIECTYANKDNDWKKDVIEVVDETEWAIGKPKRTQQVSLIGVTSSAQALREARLALNKCRYSRKGIEFITTIAACHSEPGDIIAFQHDVPQWGWGGRAISGTSNTCVVDQDIPQSIINDPTAYDIKIIHNDDTIETKDIASVSGKTVTISGTFSTTPSEDEPYILGKEGSTIAEYRIQNISLTKEEEVQIQALEHNINIYSDTGLEISTGESTELPNPAAFAPQVSNLQIHELANRAGTVISFRQPDDGWVGNEITITDVTSGVCTTSDTEGLRKGDFIKFATGEFNGRKYKVTALTKDTSFTISDTTLTDTGTPGTCYEYDNSLPMTWDHADVYISTDNVHFEKIAEGYGDDAIEYYEGVFPGLTYYVRVYSINKIGIKNPSPATASIAYTGKITGRPFAPTGLEIAGQGNDNEFSGRDCKVVWRLNAPFGGSGSLAPELPAGLTADIAGAFVKDFVVQVWSTTQTGDGEWIVNSLVREEIVTDKWYIYTFEKNFEDNAGSPIGDFIFRIYQRNYYYKLSDQYAKLDVHSDTPSAPTGLSSTAEEDGVTFTWNESTISDFNYYEYRTKVNSGSWSSWDTSYDNKVTRWLTGTEMAEQGQGRSTIYIEVRIVDIFGTTSSASSANTACNNFKGFYTVSPTAGQGHFTTIASAVDALSETGGTILLMEGKHTLPSNGINFPDKDYVLSGDGVLKTKIVPGGTWVASAPFKILGNSSTYRFSNFSASQISSAGPYYIIDCNATTVPPYALESNNAKVEISNIKITQMSPGQGNYGLRYRGVGKLTVDNCEITDGYMGTRLYGKKVVITNNEFRRQRLYSIALWSTNASQNPEVRIEGNTFDPCYYYGIYTFGEDLRGGAFSNNTFIMSTATGALEDITGSNLITAQYGIYLDRVQDSTVNSNKFIWVNASKLETSLLYIRHIHLNKTRHISVAGNTCEASLDNGGAQYTFVAAAASTDTTSIVGNTGVILNASSNGNFVGVRIIGDCTRNVISDNNFRMNNRAPNDMGIALTSGSTYNYGRGNLVWNAAYDIYDQGASNDVTGTLT